MLETSPSASLTSPADDTVANRRRVSLALAAGRTGVWSWEPASGAIHWDSRIASIWGLLADEKPDAGAFIASVHRDDRENIQAAFTKGLTSGNLGEDDDLEFRITRFDDGRERWIAGRGKAFFAPDGSAIEIVGTARDITDHKLHDIHLQMLLREITHRSKNLLAIIQAMARQTVKDSLTAAEFEQRLSLRLRGLAASHELLAAQDWHGAHLEELVKGQLGPVLDQFSSRIVFRGPSLFLKPEAAQNIGLAINELATNAVRFGALSNAQGRIEIGWSIDPVDEQARRLHLTWNELDGPTVAPPARQGFGHKVVERVAARALDGSVNLTFAPSGLQWSLHIPMVFVLSGNPATASGMPRFF